MKFAPSYLVVVGCCCASTALADPPSFDRPGIAFSTGVTPRGSVTVEQGLPDVQTDRADGVRTTTFMTDTNVRVGLLETLELQLATSLWNHARVRGHGMSDDDGGAGDTRIGLKAALPGSSDDFSWASLGSITLATGEAPFSNQHTQYDLGVASSMALGAVDGGLYVDAARLHGETSWTISPSLSMAIDDRFGTYAELGFYRNGGAPDESVAGGGVTWMVTPSVQLDLSADFGLNAKSTDLAAGFGVSVLLPM